jgi:hypothetical protein
MSHVSRRFVFLAFSIALGILILGCGRQTVDLAAERAAVLKTIDAENAHLIATDTAALRADLPEGDTAYNVVNGQIFRMTHANVVDGYNFAIVRYTAATSLDSPVVHLSPDGRMAWIAASYRLTYIRKNAAGTEQQGELVNAGLAVYEKRGGRWVGAALAQTFPSAGH